MRIIAGIVTYNPSMNRLNECLNSVLSELKDVLIFDNGSNNAEEILQLIENYRGNARIFIIGKNRNHGIAYGLRTIMRFADIHDYEWVLTLDQDSVLRPGLVALYP